MCGPIRAHGALLIPSPLARAGGPRSVRDAFYVAPLVGSGGRSKRTFVTVVYDPEAVLDLERVKAKEERKALFNAVDKLRRLGAQLTPPHVKSLKGEGDLYELRPRQGRSAVRPLYCRFEDVFVILAIATKPDFVEKARLATERASRYSHWR